MKANVAKVETKGDITYITVGVSQKKETPPERTVFFDLGVWWNDYREQLRQVSINAPDNVPTVVVDAFKAAGFKPVDQIDAIMLMFYQAIGASTSPAKISDQEIQNLQRKAEQLEHVERSLATLLNRAHTTHALDYITVLAAEMNHLRQQNIELQSKYFALRGADRLK